MAGQVVKRGIAHTETEEVYQREGYNQEEKEESRPELSDTGAALCAS